jgi:broad specificity phosphatase PhoE
MRIGLMRHFPVELRFPSGWRTAADLKDWLRHYDASPVLPGRAELGNRTWNRCICSDLERAAVTARTVFPGPIEPTHLLREPGFEPFQTGGLRLPVPIWIWIVRLSWWTGHSSQRACRDDFRRRVLAMADRLESETGNTLVVSHAGMMANLSAELRRRGFAGPRLRMARHAVLYVYEHDRRAP